MLETPQSPPHPAACLEHSSAVSSKRSSALDKYIAILHWKTQLSKLQQFWAEGLPWPENIFHIYCLTTDFFLHELAQSWGWRSSRTVQLFAPAPTWYFPSLPLTEQGALNQLNVPCTESPFKAWVIITSPFYAFPAHSRLSFSSDNNQNCTRCARNQ